MKNKKSIYRILISLLGVLSVVLAGNCVFAEDAGNSDGFLRRQNMLSAFGVWQEPSEESEEITRAEFVMLIGKIFNIGESNQRYFIDVQDSHKASGIINMAFEKGIVIGYDDGLFRPENPISCDEALLITLKSLGYTEQILNSYDNSLMRSKILKDIPAGNMTWDSAFKLAENLFDVKPLVFATGEGDKHGLQESENNVWEACQGIYKMTGILELSGKFSTFYNTSKNEQIIQINGETFETDGKDYSEYFGMNVCAYYYEDKHADERTVLYMEPYGRQTKETIIAQDIISADQDCIKYELPNDSKERKIQIKSEAKRS